MDTISRGHTQHKVRREASASYTVVLANSTIKSEFLTATGSEGGLDTEEVTKAQAWKANNELIWLIYGRYQFTTGSEAVNEQVVVPLEFDAKNRALRALPVFRGTLNETDWVQMRHGRGVRIPGIISTRGYLLSKSRKGIDYISPFRLERTDDIAVRVGLFVLLQQILASTYSGSKAIANAKRLLARSSR